MERAGIAGDLDLGPASGKQVPLIKVHDPGTLQRARQFSVIVLNHLLDKLLRHLGLSRMDQLQLCPGDPANLL